MTTISYTPHALSSPFSGIDHLTDELKHLAHFLDRLPHLTEDERREISNSLKQISHIQRRIDDDAEDLQDRYHIADEERDELWDELQTLKNKQESAPRPGPHLENDLYTAIHAARTRGCKQVILPYEVAELAHAIILTLDY